MIEVYSVSRTNNNNEVEYFSFSDHGPLWLDDLTEEALTVDPGLAKFYYKDNDSEKDIKLNSYLLTPI